MTDIDDRPSVGELYAIAASSGDLTPREGRCDADRLLAAAYAAGVTCTACDGAGRIANPGTGATVRCVACFGRGRLVEPRKTLALAVYRARETGDLSQLHSIVTQAEGWLSGRLSRGGNRPLRREARRALVVDTLHWWMNPTCPYCEGRRKVAMEQAAALSTQSCEACHGTGKRPLHREVPRPHVHHAEWLAEQLDELLIVVFKDMARVLAPRLEL